MPGVFMISIFNTVCAPGDRVTEINYTGCSYFFTCLLLILYEDD